MKIRNRILNSNTFLLINAGLFVAALVFLSQNTPACSGKEDGEKINQSCERSYGPLQGAILPTSYHIRRLMLLANDASDTAKANPESTPPKAHKEEHAEIPEGLPPIPAEDCGVAMPESSRRIGQEFFDAWVHSGNAEDMDRDQDIDLDDLLVFISGEPFPLKDDETSSPEEAERAMPPMIKDPVYSDCFEEDLPDELKNQGYEKLPGEFYEQQNSARILQKQNIPARDDQSTRLRF